jgi:hypothetical protein
MMPGTNHRASFLEVMPLRIAMSAVFGVGPALVGGLVGNAQAQGDVGQL